MFICYFCFMLFFFVKQKTAYEMRISDWSSDVCSSDLLTWDEESVMLRIADDGPGFDVTVLSRLGEPYYSTGARARRRGEDQHMGLGIFIARTLLAHHGASLEFSNEVTGGAVVEIRWPRGRSEEHTSELQSLMRISYAV